MGDRRCLDPSVARDVSTVATFDLHISRLSDFPKDMNETAPYQTIEVSPRSPDGVTGQHGLGDSLEDADCNWLDRGAEHPVFGASRRLPATTGTAFTSNQQPTGRLASAARPGCR
jgi:hypothetical protein